MKKIKHVTLVLSILLLVSCESSQIKPEAAASISKSNGILVASVTRGMKQGGVFTRKNISAWYYVKKVGAPKGSAKIMKSHAYKLMSQNNELEQYDDDGRVVTLELEPGDYEVIGWTLYVPTGNGYKYIESEKFPHKQFTIRSGSANYIGELHLETVYVKNIFGVSIEGGAKSSCSNDYERDIKIFKEKYPPLNDWPITINPIEC